MREYFLIKKLFLPLNHNIFISLLLQFCHMISKGPIEIDCKLNSINMNKNTVMKTNLITSVFRQAVAKGLHMACLLFALCSIHLSKAQNEPEPQQNPVQSSGQPTYTQQFDSVFRADPNRVPHGILYDRVFPFACLKQTDPCDTLDPFDIFQAWSEVERSAFTPIEGLSYSDMREQTKLMHLSNEIATIAVDVHIAAIDSTAFEDGRLIMTPDSVLYDAGLASPYITYHAQRLGLSKNELYSDIPYTIKFDETFILSNTDFSPDRLQIETPNGEIVVLTPGEQYTFNLLETLEGEWVLTLESDTDPTNICNTITMQSLGPYFPQPIGNCIEGERWIIESDIGFRGYDEKDYTNSLANAHVYYHLTPGNPCKIIKPVIILDGFDPGDRRNFRNIYQDALAYESNNSLENLGRDLRKQGYDVIILNFPVLGDQIALDGRSKIKLFNPDGSFTGKRVDRKGRDGGADYIERNAFLLVKLIQLVNAQLKLNNSTEQVVVVGPSMGGLISRYALAYMEKRDDEGDPNMKHNCRLWVSFDAPQQGANISAGTQYSLEFFSEDLGVERQKELYHHALRSVAARQMLVHSTPSKYGNDVFKAPFFRAWFKANQRKVGLAGSEGYPQNTRNVSLLNGSLSGTSNFTPAQFDVFIEASKAGVKAFKYVTRTSPPPGQTAKVFEFMKRNTVKILGVKLPWTKYEADPGKVTNSNPNLFQDNDQGSFYVNDENLSLEIIRSLKDQKVNDISVYYDNMDFTFINSFSALDINRTKYPNANANLQKIDLVCEGSTPFDAYFVPNQNQKHVFLDEANVDWVMKEIQKGRPGCRDICPEADNWSHAICNNSQTDFKLINLPQNSAYGIFWEVDDNIFNIKGSRTGAKISVAANKTGNQYKGFIRANIHFTCAPTKVFEKEVEIPSTNAEIKGEDFICEGNRQLYEMVSETRSFNHRWYFGDANGIYQHGTPYTNLPAPNNNAQPYDQKHFAEFGGDRTGVYTIYAEATNDCQETITSSKLVSIMPKQSCSRQKEFTTTESDVYVYPNPTQSSWILQLPLHNDIQITRYELFDQTGRKLQQVDSHTAFANINAKDLPNGIYVLNISLSNGKHIQKKLIKH
jgi:pimeloyl-ACP methyl ester carboxylesterase